MGATKIKDHKADKGKVKKWGKRGKSAEEPKKKKIIEGVKGIVRLVEADLDGNKKVSHSLLKIKGVSHSLAGAVTKIAGIDPNLLMGTLSDEELKKIENIIRSPIEHGIPEFMVNRQADPETGENNHIVSSKLIITKKLDVDRMKKIHAYRGVRHEWGLPVRGQRTRGSFRTGQTAGVVKAKLKKDKSTKKEAPAAAGEKSAGEKKEAGKKKEASKMPETSGKSKEQPKKDKK